MGLFSVWVNLRCKLFLDILKVVIHEILDLAVPWIVL